MQWNIFLKYDLVPKDENMTKLGFQKNLLLMAMATALFATAGAVETADSLEFDDSILKSMGFDNVDLSAFSGNGDQFLGEYSAGIKLNSNIVVSDYTIQFYQDVDGSQVCITPDFADKIALRATYLDILKKSSEYSVGTEQCLNVLSLDSSISIYFDASQQVVNISMPQAYLEDRDDAWVKPEYRDDGIPGVILDYSLIWDYDRKKHRYTGIKGSTSSVRSYGTLGGNWGRFRVRADYQYYSKASDGNKEFDWSQIYGFTDIASWNSKLFVGEINSNSNVFESARIKGVSLYSDENMMPSYLRGYAPQITGVVSSNAIVTISQRGSIIKTEQVAPGPFVISDISSHIVGVVTVDIEEANGEKRSYQVDIAQVPFLTRKGAVRYSANIGEIAPLSGNKVGTTLISGDLSYGIGNNVSLFGGVQHTTNNEFKAFNVGFGVDLGEFGALSVDVTKSKSRIDDIGEDRSGTSYRFNYAKRFTSSTNLNIAGYRFSSRGYTGLHNYIIMKQEGSTDATAFEKNRFTLSLSQQFSEIGLSVTGTISKSIYWNRKSISNYAITFNKNIRREGFFKNSTINLTLSQDSGDFYDRNRRIAVYLSIPLDSENNGRIQYGARYNTTNRYIDQNMRYYATGLGGDYSFGATAGHKRDLSGSIDYSLDARYDIDTGYGRFNSSVDYDEYRQSIRAGFDGSLTLTSYGLATHGRAYSGTTPRLILDAGAPGVPMGNGQDSSNIFGLAGISNISSYNYTSHQVDGDNLPDNVEIPEGIVDVAVSDGAIAYRSLGGISGEKAISTITLSDGSYPPFGATVYRENGENREVAIVADQGLTYLTGLKRNVRFIVKWNGSQSCELQIKSLDPDDIQNLTCY